MGKSLSKNKKEKDEEIPPGMIRIYINGINTKIHCYPHITVGNFTSYIRNELNIPSKCHIILIHHNLIIQKDLDIYKSLDHYNIRNNSCLLLCTTEPNKTNISSYKLLSKTNQTTFRKNCCSMTINDSYIETMMDLDILTYEISSKCLKMKCGHGMTQQTLYQYALSQLKAGATMIKCPHIDDFTHTKCDAIWYQPLIKSVLMYNNINCASSIPLQDVLHLDLMTSKNMIKQQLMTTHCGECDTGIYRDKLDIYGDKFDLRTFCPICDNTFCWNCHCNWENMNSDECKSEKCKFNFEAEVLDILQSAPKKQIGTVLNVPSIRCCPQCLQLINHSDACKHVKCKVCQCHFCFVCMGVNDGNWHCGSSSDVCPIAPIEIPNITNN